MLSLLYYLLENYLGEQMITEQSGFPETDQKRDIPHSYYQPCRSSRKLSDLFFFKQMIQCFDDVLNPDPNKLSYRGIRLLSKEENTILSHEAKRLLYLIVDLGILNSHHLERTLALSTMINGSLISIEQFNRLISLSLMNSNLSVDELAALCDETVLDDMPKEVIH